MVVTADDVFRNACCFQVTRGLQCYLISITVLHKCALNPGVQGLVFSNFCLFQSLVACYILSLEVNDKVCPFLYFTFSIGRAGATEWSFPAAFSSSCHHEVLSAPGNHKSDGGPRGRQLTSECGKRDREVMSTQRHCYNVELAWYTCVTSAFKCGRLPLSQLDQMCLEKRPALGDATMTESQKQNIQAILDLLEQSGQVESAQTGQSASVFTALHLITSAMDGEKAEPLLLTLLKWSMAWSPQSVEKNPQFKVRMRSMWSCVQNAIRMFILILNLDLCLSEMTNDCLALLGMCCSITVLQPLELLVSEVSFYKGQ